MISTCDTTPAFLIFEKLKSTVAPRLAIEISPFPALKRRAKLKSRSAAGSLITSYWAIAPG